MLWRLSNRADKRALPLADRHYNRQKIGSPQFAPPGSCLVLLTDSADAFWITSWPKAEYVKHAWAGAWVCSAFRNESQEKATDLIRDAVSASLWYYKQAPELGLVTFLDATKVEPVIIRGMPTFGYTWIKSGFSYVGKTKGGLLAYQLLPKDMPQPKEPLPKHGTGLLA